MTSAEPPEYPAGSGSGADPFSWLYQRGQPAPTEDVAPPVPPTVEAPAQPTRSFAPQTAPPTTPQPPPSQPPGPPPAYVLQAYQPWRTPEPVTAPPPPPPPAKSRGPLIAVLVGVALLAVVAGVVVAVLVHGSDQGVVSPPVGTPSSATRPTSPAPAKPAKPAKPVATGVSADCTAPPATDDAGRPVSYDATNVLDGDPSTAWRCNGSGDGRTLTFSFPPGTTIGTLGLINGYAKTDPKSGAKRYGEYRRITKVTWTFDSGKSVDQNVTDGTQTVQTTTITPVTTQRVTLTIDASTKPGQSAKTRDAVLISDVSFG